jgi:hypothetical protein
MRTCEGMCMHVKYTNAIQVTFNYQLLASCRLHVLHPHAPSRELFSKSALRYSRTAQRYNRTAQREFPLTTMPVPSHTTSDFPPASATIQRSGLSISEEAATTWADTRCGAWWGMGQGGRRRGKGWWCLCVGGEGEGMHEAAGSGALHV